MVGVHNKSKYLLIWRNSRFVHILIFLIHFQKKGGLLVKKSIFASPDSVTGRVGIGTCGVSGLPMTEYSQAEKRKKGSTNMSLLPY